MTVKFVVNHMAQTETGSKLGMKEAITTAVKKCRLHKIVETRLLKFKTRTRFLIIFFSEVKIKK